MNKQQIDNTNIFFIGQNPSTDIKQRRHSPQDKKKEASPKTCFFANQFMLALAKTNNLIYDYTETDQYPDHQLE
jgi:hypothetical protein